MKTLTVIDQLNDFEYNFFDNDNGIIMRDFEGFEYPDVRSVVEDVSGSMGSVFINSKFGRRRLSWSGDIVHEDVFEIRREMLKALKPTGSLKLIKFTTYDDLALQFEADIVKVVNPYNHKIHTYLIEAVAPDWRFYSQTEKNVDAFTSFITGGASIPMTIPASLTSSLSSYEAVNQSATNDGTEDTDPLFTIYGPGISFEVGNETTGKSFTIDHSINADEFIEIDAKNRTIKLNGTTNIYDDFSGEFWPLIPGENELRFIISGGIGSTTKLTLTYRDAYMGI